MANDLLGKATTDPEYLALQAALGTAGAMLMAIKATEDDDAHELRAAIFAKPVALQLQEFRRSEPLLIFLFPGARMHLALCRPIQGSFQPNHIICPSLGHWTVTGQSFAERRNYRFCVDRRPAFEKTRLFGGLDHFFWRRLRDTLGRSVSRPFCYVFMLVAVPHSERAGLRADQPDSKRHASLVTAPSITVHVKQWSRKTVVITRQNRRQTRI